MAIPWSALRTTRHLLAWVRDRVWPSLSCVLLQYGEVETNRRDDQTGGEAGVYARVRVTNRRARPGAIQTVQVCEKRHQVWQVEALILFPQREEISLPLTLAPAQAYEIGLRARSSGSVLVGKRHRVPRLTLRVQDHQGRRYRLRLKRRRTTMLQPLSHPTPSV
jgi:hypothetical protein